MGCREEGTGEKNVDEAPDRRGVRSTDGGMKVVYGEMGVSAAMWDSTAGCESSIVSDCDSMAVSLFLSFEAIEAD